VFYYVQQEAWGRLDLNQRSSAASNNYDVELP